MVKAKTKSLNILIPEDLSDWLTDYAKSKEKTKTEIICSLLQGIKNDDAYPDVDKSIDNSVDSIEAIVKAYLDKHLHSHVDSYMIRKEAIDIEPHVVTESLPIIEAIANITAPSIEKSLDSEVLNEAITESNKSQKVTYSINHDGSVILRSLRGITIKALKRMNDQELKEIGLFKTLIGLNEKFFPSEYPASTDKQKTTKRSPKSKEILTRSEALEIAQSFNPKVIGQNLYDWAKSALTAKSEESKQSAKEKLAAVGLAPTYSNEGTIAWLAIEPANQGEGNENS